MSLHTSTIIWNYRPFSQDPRWGFFYDFIRRGDPKTLLYERYFREFKLDRFDETSREFLVRGFAEAGVEAPTDLVDPAVEKLDGIVGWLVAFSRMWLEKVSRGYRRKHP